MMSRIETVLLSVALCACVAACNPDKKITAVPVAVADAKTADVVRPAAAPDMAPPAIQGADVRVAGADVPTAAEARQVVVDYYVAINARDYKKAYASWDQDGAASRQNYEDFSGGYTNTEAVEATIGQPFDAEGAAGFTYITVPVELVAKQYNGTARSYHGRFALRAVTADGASGQQRRWHLISAEMQRLP